MRKIFFLVVLMGGLSVSAFDPAMGASKKAHPDSNKHVVKSQKASYLRAKTPKKTVTTKGVSNPQRLLKDVEGYLNGLKTVKANFHQKDAQGNVTHGTLYLSRPGRVRLEYNPPSPLLIISDGSWVSYQDKQLDEISYVPLSSTPAEFILRERVNFKKDISVDRVEQQKNHIFITLSKDDDSDWGQLVLGFQEKPLQLTQWKVIDAQGNITHVILENFMVGGTIPEKHFKLSE
ncbi:MAG: outer membrane lipoprotein carrier protein LolA [Alphaproteobacteria bacterium]|jgi:outer membrane lipoprotein-sorting protein|nr:outer membrane lipoprotein carrier protein LolA [Alphaproteobacteria bacterium]MBT5390558.1 outer membrane lipoprotein carrier protein LolA [Alphaproteobacteria bacterium]MBT5540917.1 outer membrane lipoprotein carrier protein LolA [Alphaproteobacteria bacterium]MBT5654336.1 outer membrane lipoprotein carrier protein LolA [Alphaproteobacteria bacterium]